MLDDLSTAWSVHSWYQPEADSVSTENSGQSDWSTNYPCLFTDVPDHK